MSSRDSNSSNQSVESFIDKYARRLRFVATLRALGLAIATVLASLIAVLLLDRFLVLDTTWRIVLSCATWTLAALTFAPVLIRLFEPYSKRDLARRVERKLPELEGGLLTLVDLSSDQLATQVGHSPQLLDVLRQRVEKKIEVARAESLVEARSAKRVAMAALFSVFVVGFALAAETEASKQLLRRFLSPQTVLPRPTSVELAVTPGDGFYRRARELHVEARVIRGSAELARLEIIDDDARRDFMEAHETQDSRFRFQIRRARGVLKYRVLAGDFASPIYTLTPADPPTPQSFHIDYEAPEYTALEKRSVVAERGDLQGLAGSRASIGIETDLPLHSAKLRLDDNNWQELDISDRTARTREAIPIEKHGSLTLVLAGLNGLDNSPGHRFRIIATPDAAPRIDLLKPSSSEVKVESRGQLTLRFRAEDDIGIHSVSLIDAKDRSRSLWTHPPGVFPKIVDEQSRVDLSSLSCLPGESRQVRLRVQDSQGKKSDSRPLMLRVAYASGAPEGRDWILQLGNLQQTLGALRLDLDRRKVTTPGGLLRFAAEVQATARFAEQAAQQVAVPSPHRFTLQALAARLDLGLVEITDIENVALDASVAKLRSLLDTVTPSADLLLQLAEIEDIVESFRLLQLNLESIHAAWKPTLPPNPEDARDLRALSKICRELVESLARLDSDENSELSATARAFETAVLTEIDLAATRIEDESFDDGRKACSRAASACERRLPSLGRMTQRRRDALRDESDISDGQSLPTLLQVYASSKTDLDQRRLLKAIEIEIARRESFSFEDFETLTVLSSMHRLLERGGSEEMFSALQTAFATTAPLRDAGRWLAWNEWIADGNDLSIRRFDDELSTRPSQAGHAVRSAASIARSFRILDKDLRENSTAAALTRMSRSVSEQLDAVAELGFTDPAKARQSGRMASAGLAQITELAEGLRGNLPRDVQKARAWFREQLGSLPDRAAQLAALSAAAQELVTETLKRGQIPEPQIPETLSFSDVARDARSLSRDIDREFRLTLRKRAPATKSASYREAAQRCQRAGQTLQFCDSLIAKRLQNSDDPFAFWRRIEEKLEEVTQELENAARLLVLAESDGLAALEQGDLSDDITKSATETHVERSIDELLPLARRFLRASEAALEDALKLNAKSELEREFLTKLRTAVSEFASAILAAENNEEPKFRQSFALGLDALSQAVAIAGELRDPTNSSSHDSNHQKADAAKNPELAALQAELARLEQLNAKQASLEEQLEKLLSRQSPDPASLEKAIEAQKDLLAELEAQSSNIDELLKLVAQLDRIVEETRELGETIRALEEESRQHLAAESTFRNIEIQQLKECVSTLSRVGNVILEIGSQLTALLPKVWTAQRKAQSVSGVALQSMESSLTHMQENQHSQTVAALEEAQSHLGRLLLAMDKLRQSTLAAISESRRGDLGANTGNSAMRSATQNLAESQQQLALGNTQEAAQSMRSAGRSMRSAAAGLRSRVGLSGQQTVDGNSGAGWQMDTRGESAILIETGSTSGIRENMAYPQSYHELVRHYLDLLRSRR